MTTLTQNDQRSPGRHALRTFAGFVVLFLLYAFAVQVTEIDMQRLQNESRQSQVINVLRFLADPDVTNPDPAELLAGEGTGELSLTSTTRDTGRLIVETIFMALMATTIGTVLAVPVSFLAARNLMIELTAPLAAIMLGIVGLGAGTGLAYLAVGQLLGLSRQLAQQTPALLGGLVGVLLAAGVLYRLGPPLVSPERRPRSVAALAAGRWLLILVLLLVGLGFLASLGSLAGRWLIVQLVGAGLSWLSFLGNFVVVLSDLINLLLVAAVALVGGLVGASLGSRYGQEMVLSLGVAPARTLSAVAAAAGSAVLVYAVGASLNWLYQFDNPANWTTVPALVAAGGMGVLALVLSPRRPFRVGAIIYAISRSILNILRSIEPLIMAVVFVVWVGLGPFAGVMALTLHTIAALGKLFSEQIEGISEGPIEAITSTGASRLQTIVFAVIPQIVPPYIAYTLYRWDINVRMSTIIGFVGGGGVGFLLSQSIRLLRYREASVMMVAIAIVVSALDYFSARIRSRII